MGNSANGNAFFKIFQLSIPHISSRTTRHFFTTKERSLQVKKLESISSGEGSSSFECDDDQRLLRQTYGHVIEEHFVGMKNDIDRLVSRVRNDDRSSRVISICGMGGLGKTTLARKIYQHKFGFEARAWVCITQKLQAKSIFQGILRQLLPGENNERVKGTDEAELVRDSNSKQFEAIGRELARKCGHLPLALSVIGGILRGQRYLGDWKKVLENMDSHLKHEKGVDGNDKRVEQVLNLSYDVLPYYLKLCFLYLGCFPEDEDINVEDAYLIWMAEGLISSDDEGRNETLWDVAERYLNELGSKCMVQVMKSMTERLKSCRLHDLLRDLCLSKGKEEKFFEDSQGKFH